VETEAEYTPLANLSPDQAPFMVYDSVLSEYAALGFEYGYSIADHEALVCWEAQFGDFANVGQTIVDQFVVSAEDKWGQRSGLVLLLPHGFEGQGPEHSSARLERFLVLCAEDNIRVTVPTTAAQYFHVLRRQMHDPVRKPLVVLTPKRYLRMPATASPLAAFTDGAFDPVLDDPTPPALDTVERLVLCAGKFGHQLIERRDATGAPVAVVRVEQLYPVPTERVRQVLGRYPNLREVLWVQEEPSNMGALPFVSVFLRPTLPEGVALHMVGRSPSPSPATGSQIVHDREQQELLAAAIPDAAR
jgi:multifunctional 2-oxoglutarate metabolism enzyme